MKNDNHDRLAYRLATILEKLNLGEKLYVGELADEFKVGVRTIQRDIERLNFLDLDRGADKGYSIKPILIGRIYIKDIERFASLAGLSGIAPGLDTAFLRELMDSRLQDAIEVRGPSRESIERKAREYHVLKDASLNHRMVRFTYEKPNSPKKRVDVSPYRLVNQEGVWYLAATDEGRPKSYALSRITDIEVLSEQFEPDESVVKMLDEEDSIWLNRNKTEVVLTVAPAVSSYFRRRSLISQQKIEKELEDGGLIISGKFATQNQLFPIVRYWLPNVRIVSPESWQEDLDRELESYVRR